MMKQEELQRLSVAELVNLVLHLQHVNKQMRLTNQDSGGEHTVYANGDTSALDHPDEHSGDKYAMTDDDADHENILDKDDQLRRTSLLLQLSIEFRETLDPSVIVERMLHVMVKNLGISNASIVLIALDGSVELAMSLRDGTMQQVTTLVTRAVLDRGLAGWVLRHGRSVILPDVSRDKRWIPYSDWQRTGSAIVLPIRQAQTTLGVLTVYHPQANHFGSHYMLLMEGVAAQAGVALGAARRYLEESRRREQALALFAMTQFLTTERSYDDLAAMLQEKSVTIFGVDYGLLYLVRDDKAPVPAFSPVSLPPALLHAGNKPLVRQAAVTVRKAWEQKSIVTDMDPPDNPTQTVIAVPLVHSSTVIGAVALIRTSSNGVTFTANIWSMLTTFTNVIAATCANMKLVGQLRTHAEKLETLVEERTAIIQNSRDMLRVVFDNLPEGLVLLDPNEMVLAANNAFCYPIMGQHPRTIVGVNMTSVWEALEQRGELQIEHRSISQLTGLSAGGKRAMRVLCTTSIGQQRWYEVSRIAVSDEHEEVEYYVERWLDITRQEAIERQMIARDQRNILGQLTSRVVHDINTPLQDVLKHLDNCASDVSLGDTVKNEMTLARGALDRIDRTVKSLHHLYKSPKTTWECLDINSLLRHLEDLVASQFTHHKVHIHYNLDPHMQRVYGQPDALRQVFLGLLGNAQEAMPQGGIITVTSLYERGNKGSIAPLCRINIHDTGVGMTDAQIADLFEPFMSNKEQGVGMGLYLSKHIIEQHKGRIEITSKPQEGTMVSVFLPADERCGNL